MQIFISPPFTSKKAGSRFGGPMSGFIKTLFLLLFAFYLGESLGRQKRSIINLCGVIECATNRTSCLDFNNYGCFCGWGGYGTPVDEIDRCCKEHDVCYDYVRKLGCPIRAAFNHYRWHCMHGMDRNFVECDQIRSDFCDKFSCGCDRLLGECLAKHPYPPEKPACKRETTYVPDPVSTEVTTPSQTETDSETTRSRRESESDAQPTEHSTRTQTQSSTPRSPTLAVGYQLLIVFGSSLLLALVLFLFIALLILLLRCARRRCNKRKYEQVDIFS